MTDATQRSWRAVLVVAAIAVGVVLGADFLTSQITPLDGLVFHTPLLIAILLVGTAGVLIRLATRRPPEA